MNISKSASWVRVMVLIMLVGCADPPPPPRSASKEIGEAEDSVESGEKWIRQGKPTQALSEYRRAKESISEGKSFAQGKELDRLKTLDEEVRRKVVDLETQVMVLPDSTPAPKKVAATKIDSVETAAKAEDEKLKAKAAQDAKAASELASKLALKDDKTSGKATKEDPDETAAKPKAADKGDKPDGDAADAQGAEKKKPVGIFPALTESSPPVNIVRVVTHGKYMFAYFQLYNKTEQGKRIIAVNAFFKDKDNQPLKEPQPVVAVFPYANFKEDAKDPIEQPHVTALTSGSAQVLGNDGLQLVAVGEHDKASTCKKVAIRVIYEPGPSEVGTGPDSGAINDGGGDDSKSVIKNLK